MKKTFLTGLAIILVLGISTGCGCMKKKEKNKTEDKTKETYNTNENVIKDQEVEGLKLTNTSLVSTENSAQLVTSVSNPTDKDIEVKIFYIHVKDKNGDEIVKLKGYVGGVVPAGQTRDITSNVDRNLDNAASIEYELIKE